MNCHDAREWLSDVIDDGLEAEVRTQVDAHLAGCADCRLELERLGATVSMLRAVERPQAPVGFAERVLAAPRPDSWHRRLRDRLAAIRLLRFPVEAAAMVLVASLALYVFQETPGLRRAARFETAMDQREEGVPATESRPAGPDPASTPTVSPPAVSSKSLRATAPPPSPPTSPFGAPEALLKHGREETRATAEDLKDVTNRATATSKPAVPPAPPPTSGTPATSPATPPRRAASEAPPSSPMEGRLRSLLSDEASRDEGAAGGSTGQSSPVPVEPQLGDRMKRERAQERAERAPVPFRAPGPSGQSVTRLSSLARVHGRLTVKDRQEANRELSDLVRRVGGAEMARRAEETGDTVHLVIPWAAYPAFTQGLGRIGSWLPDAEPTGLPDQVVVTLRIGQ